MEFSAHRITRSKDLYVISITYIAALTGLLFGWFMSAISGAETSIQETFGLTNFWHGFTISIAVFGNLAGAISVGKPADSLGRKKMLLILGFLIGIASLGSALSPHWEVLVFFRLLGGAAAGGTTVLGPMYIAEVAPAHLRGRLVMLYQLNLVIGILLAFLGNYLIADWLSTNAWRWMLGIVTAPALFVTLLLGLIPPTPRWLVLKRRTNQARSIMAKLHPSGVTQSFEQIQQSIQQHQHQKESIFNNKYRFPLLLVIFIALFNQLSGIAAVMNYAPRIFQMGGFMAESALFQTILVGGTNLLFTVIAIPIIDRIGRRKLLVWGSLGMMLFLGLIAVNFSGYLLNSGFLVTFLLGFIACFAFSQGAVVWVLISEILPNKVRAKGQAVASFTHAITAAAITWIFPAFTNLGYGKTVIFGFFSLMMLAHLIFVVRYVPETKGKTLEEIQFDLGIQ